MSRARRRAGKAVRRPALDPGRAGCSAVLAVLLLGEQPVRLGGEFPLGSLPGIGEVAGRVAHHPLGTVVVVLDRDVDRHACLPHAFSVGPRPPGHNGRPASSGNPAAIQASATASSPPSSRMSGTSARLIPSGSRASTISMPNAFGPAATGTAAKAW